MRLITKLLAIPMLLGIGARAQTTITQWDFNSNPPDASNSTGSSAPSTGSGTVSAVGGVTISGFSSASGNGGSSDPVASDNTGWQTTGYPSASTGDKTAGIQFNVATTGYQNITVSWDLRHSNTSSRYEQLQYTLDVTQPAPVWVDFGTAADGNAGDTWFNNRSYNLSAITGLDNNPNAAFRVVATFNGSSSYAPSSASGTYAGSGTWRFDMVTVSGTSTSTTDNIPPIAQSHIVTSNTTSFVRFNEPLSAATATNVANYVFNSSLAVSNATLSASGDTVFLTHAALTDGQAYTLTVSNVQDVAGNTMTSTNFNVLYNSSLPNLVITEIIHSPNNIEMIEVYNAGAASINLGGLSWANGTTGSFPVISLAAGTTAVFAMDPTNASTILGVTPVYTINNGLGSSNDILVIKNSLGQNVDSVEYFIGTNGWPAAPIGQYAYSFELTSATADNALGSNWMAPQNPVTPQPSQGVITATPGVYPTPPYVPATATISFVGGTKLSVAEASAPVDIVASLTGNNTSAVSVDLEVIPMSTASAGDYTLPPSLQFNWPANSNGMNDTITITINNDAVAENAEYFIVRFANAVNTTLPSATANHFTVFINDDDKQAPLATGQLTLTHLGSFNNGTAGVNSAEIVAYDSASHRLFIANSIGAKIDIVDFDNPASPSLITSVAVNPTYGNINSIAVKNGIVAAAIENLTPELPGKIVFFDTNGVFISQVNAGAMPDMITFNHAGTKVLTANEGQPNDAYTADPEGSVTIVDISGGVAAVTQSNVTTATFTSFNPQIAMLKSQGIRIFGPGATVAQDMEPEYITISDNDQTAWVTCQENNAIAVINLTNNTITQLFPLGTKDHLLGSNSLDASDQGTAIQIANWPVKGVYMPDAVAQYTVNGQTYLVTANEGDAREYNGYEETGRLGDATYVLDSMTFPYREALKANIGRINITTASGDTDNDGDFDEIHVYGGRSFTIWNAATGALVWDSGNELEEITSRHPTWGVLFNAHNENNTLKNRSDDKGPEPEGVAVAQIGNNVYAFIALERIGGCMVYNVTNPNAPAYVTYVNTRTLASYGGDNGAEGIIYIDSASSPNGLPIVVVANEISSTLSFFQVGDNVPLSISMGSIAAYNKGSINEIVWNTVSEDKGDMFEVQRSKDGSSFASIGSVEARGEAGSYSFEDVKPFYGINYYRLLLTNNDGKKQYSRIVQATMGEETGSNLTTVYPNPANQVLYIMNDVNDATLEIYNMNGALVKRQDLSADLNVIHIQELPAGNYILKYGNAKAVKQMKFIKN